MAACGDDGGSESMIHSGAAPYGNFINYYTFNEPKNRLSLIPPTLLQDLGCEGNPHTLLLDVGCNSGELSIALYKHLLQEPDTNVHLLGFDLDQTLIEQARKSNPLPASITFIPLDVTEDSEQLLDYLAQRGCSRFHLTVCLAVTMWVHLNHGDSGLLRLLSRLADLSQNLLLEAQPWKCYRSAARRLRKLGRTDFDHFKTLNIKGDISQHATEYLEGQCDMELVQNFGSTTWDRRLLLFRRRPT
ncbi:pre-miRNA 5'-monophosphate methyltransferase [Synchiropus splendidus]|uniref:pre-miRNA 5'-monophosphate methyltransferase n=1 Tax=Synchiropus splendidus TaxID=270530 RepID=UPI00237EE3C5|nr:pre-miRNA 5'-monophosphate methyltransferase [Synchiropus splendidus]